MNTHLRLDYQTASFSDDPRGKGHAQEVMRRLGITYQHSTPQSMGDCWWFWNCENIPDDLLECLKVLEVDPMEAIGWGLSQEMAEKIRDWTPNTPEAQI